MAKIISTNYFKTVNLMQINERQEYNQLNIIGVHNKTFYMQIKKKVYCYFKMFVMGLIRVLQKKFIVQYLCKKYTRKSNQVISNHEML